MKGITIQNLNLRADIRAHGAELRRFGTASGLDFLWSGDPAVWGRTSPVLFPVVGRCKGDRILLDGQSYPMPRHGFARDMDFELLLAARESCTFALRDTPRTLEAYPFPFELRVTHTLDEWTLRVSTEVVNRGETPMPFSVGAHPAFRWPLSPGVPREAHGLRFEAPEYGPIRRLDEGGLVRVEPSATPVRNQVLELRDSLFAEDVLIFDRLESQAVRLEAPGCPSLQVDWAGYRQLGLWSKPGAGFLCIEPWHGTASRQDEACAFDARPGVLVLEPGKQQAFHWSVTLLA